MKIILMSSNSPQSEYVRHFTCFCPLAQQQGWEDKSEVPAWTRWEECHQLSLLTSTKQLGQAQHVVLKLLKQDATNQQDNIMPGIVLGTKKRKQ